MGRLIVAALGLACALLAACGGESSSSSSTQTKTSKRASLVKIASPADGKRVRAKETKTGAWTARVKLRGIAAPNSRVFLRAGCRPEPCKSQTSAGAKGSWSSTIELRTRPSVRFVPIDAGPDDDLGEGSSVVTVELFGPRTVLAGAGPSKPEQNRASKRPSRVLARDVLLIGDSLGVGMASALKAELRGWRVRIDAVAGRPLAAGMRILERRSKPPAIVAFSLFTNDSPRRVSRLETAVRASATRSGGCAVWATIANTATSYAGVNRRLKQLARQEQLALGLQVVDWAGAVVRKPSLLARDGVHASREGYRTRARMYADAIRACAGEEP